MLIFQCEKIKSVVWQIVKETQSFLSDELQTEKFFCIFFLTIDLIFFYLLLRWPNWNLSNPMTPLTCFVVFFIFFPFVFHLSFYFPSQLFISHLAISHAIVIKIEYTGEFITSLSLNSAGNKSLSSLETAFYDGCGGCGVIWIFDEYNCPRKVCLQSEINIWIFLHFFLKYLIFVVLSTVKN